MSVHIQAFRQPDFPDSEKFKQVFESEMIGILFWDCDGYIFQANDVLLRMIGYTREEMLTGRLKWTDITPAEYAHLDHEMYTRLNAGEMVVPYEKQYIHKSGRRIDILMRSSFCEGSNQLGMACVLDITHQKKADLALKKSEETLREYAAKLEVSNRDLERFAGLVSYGLQEPLRKVSLFSGHLKNSTGGIPDLEVTDDIERILRTVQRMQTLVNDLLDLSKVSRRGQEFKKTDLAEVMQDVVYDLHYFRKETGGKINIGPMVSIEADTAQIRQMLDQLVENALKFARPGVPPLVSVSSYIAGNSCHITVEDNGQGMETGQLGKIFEPFVSFSKAGQAKGTGIGLSMVQKIVERHHGSIQVQSRPGSGSTFRMVLPLKQEVDHPAIDRAAQAKPKPTSL